MKQRIRDSSQTSATKFKTPSGRERWRRHSTPISIRHSELAIEIDVTSRSVPREPIYAELGVKELWRFDGKTLQVLHLSSRRKYIARAKSIAFPFLPIPEFNKFILRMRSRDQLKVLREFRKWVASLTA